MTPPLMVSISGIRGVFGRGLDPGVLVRYATAYASWCVDTWGGRGRPLVVVGRDARTTGTLCSDIVRATLRACGCDTIDAGLATTPTVEMAVIARGAAGGIVLSASHNPAEWNALKLLNAKGEFLSPEEGQDVIRRAEEPPLQAEPPRFAPPDPADSRAGEPPLHADPPRPAPPDPSDSRAGEPARRPITALWDAVGTETAEDFLDLHIGAIAGLRFIDPDAIRARDFRVVVDGINSVGGIAVPALLERLGVAPDRIVRLNCEPTGRFAHAAEPLPENLAETIAAVRDSGADLGVVVDPDADRLALIQDGGVYVSEELTQVVAADFLWGFRPGPFVTNLSSSRAIDDVAARHGQEVFRSAVGEINVVKRMQETGAVLGGEGNGGVILPDLHYGRDALVGVAMVLQHLAGTGLPMSAVRAGLPEYHIVKQKVEIGALDPDALLARVADRHAGERVSTIDGVKIDFPDGWVHLRRSNTEPIIRVYSEARTAGGARALGRRFMEELTLSS